MCRATARCTGLRPNVHTKPPKPKPKTHLLEQMVPVLVCQRQVLIAKTLAGIVALGTSTGVRHRARLGRATKGGGCKNMICLVKDCNPLGKDLPQCSQWCNPNAEDRTF